MGWAEAGQLRPLACLPTQEGPELGSKSSETPHLQVTLQAGGGGRTRSWWSQKGVGRADDKWAWGPG